VPWIGFGSGPYSNISISSGFPDDERLEIEKADYHLHVVLHSVMDLPEEDIFLPKGCMKLYFRLLAVCNILHYAA